MINLDEAIALFDMYREQRFGELIDLINSDAAVCRTTDALGDSLLHYASAGNNVDLVAVLIRAGSNVNLANSRGMTPLHEAAYNCAKDSIQILVNSGANIEAKDCAGWTPMMLAGVNRACSQRDLVAFLRLSGATLDLNTAVRVGDYSYVSQMLGSNGNAQTLAPFPNELLCDAVLRRDLSLVTLLLEYNANPSTINSAGETPIYCACNLQPTPDDILFLLVKHGASLSQPVNGVTPLSILLQSGRHDLATELESSMQ